MRDRNPLPAASPESQGIGAADILSFVNRLEKKRLNMHSYMLIRNGCAVAEGYWKPFDADSLHRMYSVSKTFTSAAVGLLIDEGRLKLDDPIIKFFPDKLPEGLHPWIAAMTVRDLLIMATPYSSVTYGIKYKDWAWTFFNKQPSHPSGTVFAYDTSGSFILDVIVERLTGIPYLEYMKKKMFGEMGMSEDMWCVKSPEGYSWGGSGVMCTTRDLAKFAQLFLNRGVWNGKRMLSEEYIAAATSKQIDNRTNGDIFGATDGYGYGYQIWMTRDNSYSFLGMGDQLAIIIPDKNIVFVCTADNQGSACARNEIYDALWDEIIYKLSDAPLNESVADDKALSDKNASLEPIPYDGAHSSPIADSISGAVYKLGESHSGITQTSVTLDGEGGVWEFTNKAGKVCRICFGIGCYRGGEFPNTEYYGDTIGTPRGTGYRYQASAAWTEEHKLVLRVYIIDDYFGNMTVTFSYKDNEIGMFMTKTAEWFLDEYQGFAAGYTETV